jgi:hypothetical protein
MVATAVALLMAAQAVESRDAFLTTTSTRLLQSTLPADIGNKSDARLLAGTSDNSRVRSDVKARVLQAPTDTSRLNQLASNLADETASGAEIIGGSFASLVSFMGLLQSDAPAGELALENIVFFGEVAGAFGYPMVGTVTTIFSSMLSGLFPGAFGGGPSETELLYAKIIAQVQLMINQNNVRNRMESVRNTLRAIGSELLWVPDVLEETSEATQVSWMLTVQHSLELAWAEVFGPCVADAGSQGCQDWQVAGTADLCLKFAALHLALVGQMAISDSANVKMKNLLLDRVNTLGKRYTPLLDSSYAQYLEHRLSQVILVDTRTDLYGERGCTHERVTNHVEDLFTGETLFAFRREWVMWCGGQPPVVPEWTYEARDIYAQRVQEITDGLQQELGQHIDTLVGPCRQPNEPCNYA